MSEIIFLKIFTVCLLGAISPGPSMVVVINNAIFKNRFHGILTSLGHGIGIAIYALFAVLGIALIIKTNIFIFNGLKLISIIFLIYLGYKSITNQSNLNFDELDLKSGIESFFQGLSISLLNPKIFIWFVAIYSQFMSIENDIIFNIYLILTAGIVDAAWYTVLTFMVTSNVALEFIKSKSKILQKIVGVVFLLIGLFLLFQVLSNFT
tara:strand:- start:273 stop:896 length:624 start_codon:yes stop_codon:yes gene_type:complete